MSSTSSSSTTSSAVKRNRTCQRKPYADGMDSDSDPEIPSQGFNVRDKLLKSFSPFFVRELLGSEVCLSYFQRHGFNVPLLVIEKTGLGMTVPNSDFSVSDVKNLVGARRIIDVMDCTTQCNSQMTLKEWEDYYTASPESSTKKLNVISLEFSQTKLEPYVVPPKIVRQIDWTENIWPRHFKLQQIDGTNDLRSMKYPKVQKYCLMSVGGCYTDFHIDFGGTSVWYHVIKGKKIFWVIPPTEVNLKAYEQWTLSGKQNDIFFGDLVEKCGMITLYAGNTFFIPSGWIHAVYTPEHSLVFGGNFLHSFAIEKQIRVAQIEESTKVPQKFRFPFFTELQWYALDKYVYALLGRTHLNLDENTRSLLLGPPEEQKAYLANLDQIHITPQELFGLKAIVMFIHALAVTKKNIPSLLVEPINLVRDVRIIVEEHKMDDLEKAVTGKPLLYWYGYQENSYKYKTLPKSLKNNYCENHQQQDHHNQQQKCKQDRIPCKICQACISLPCGKCNNCTETKFKRLCNHKTCLQPLLNPSTVCLICGLDGWYAEPSMQLIDRPPGACALLECVICYESTHPSCVTDNGVSGYVKMNLPNSWECPKCVKLIKKENPTEDKEPFVKIPKIEEQCKAISVGADASFSGYQLFSVKSRSDQSKGSMRSQLAEQILSASTFPQKESSYIFRPPPLERTAEDVYERRRKKRDFIGLLHEYVIMLGVFRKLNTKNLSQCAAVCRSWHTILQDPSLWYTVKLYHVKITPHILSLIVQRQPTKLVLDGCFISRQHLSWLLPRIPQTKSLSLRCIDFASSIGHALSSVNSPMIQELDLSHALNFNDSSLYKILSSPIDSRPGLLDKKSRQKLLRKLCLSGTEITDVSMRYLTQFLFQLNCLQISGCWKITDAGLAQLSASTSKMFETLVSLDISFCKSISNVGLYHLTKCTNLTHINFGQTSIHVEAAKKFIEEKKDLKLKINGSTIERKMSKK